MQEPDIEDVIRTVYETARGEDARESGQAL